MSFACNEPGFEEIAVPDGRRGLWMRLTRGEDGRIQKLELVAGREGDDAAAAIEVGQVVTPELLPAIEDCLSCLRFSQECAADTARGQLLTRVKTVLRASAGTAEGW